MKGKPLLVLTSLVFLSCLFLCTRHYLSATHATKEFDIDGDHFENEDGIKILQEHEFEITKDPSLGYVPKYRLVQANSQLLRQRRARENSTSQIQGFPWIERGPYSDAVGGSNGNARPGTPTPVTSGRIRAIWVDLSDASNKTVWIGAADGGIWKTTDITASPATWTPANDFMANLAISSICQDPSNNNIMYCGTGEKTFNADAVRGGGVWKSTDHGASWNLLPSTASFWNISKIVCDNSGNVYVGTIGSGAGLERSTDGGASWTLITPTINAGAGGTINTSRVADIVYDPSSNKLHVLMGYYPNSGTIYQGYCYTTSPSTVTQSSWTAATTSFPVAANSIYNGALACSGNTVYALVANASGLVPTIYKSSDAGVTWSATASSPSNSGSNAFTNGQGWYCLAISIDPSNANNVVVGSLNCYKTTNGGNTWSQISVWVGSSGNYIHADQHYAVWNGNQLLISSDGGLFYSANSGSNFVDRNVNLRLKQFYSCAAHPSSTNYFLAGAQDNGVHQFNGINLTTTVEVTGGDGAFVAIDQNEPSYQFGTYTNSHYHRSTDGGSTWSNFDFYKGNSVANETDFGSFINPFDYDNTANALYAGGDAGEFFRWTNPQTLTPGTYHAGGSGFPAGVSLVSITGFGTGSVSAVKVSPYTGNRVYFGTSAGRLIMVDNANTVSSGSAGTNLTGASFPSGGNISCVNVGTSDNNLIACFSNYGVTNIWVSSNGGTSWTGVDGNLPDIPVRWVMFYPGDNTKAIIATEAGIFQTSLLSGASTSWTQESEFPIVRTDMLSYRSSDQTIIAATHGRGLWTAIIPSVLPVTLIDFEGHLFNNRITLAWNTSMENNSGNFMVEKSSDGKNFYLIGSVPAAENSNVPIKYTLTDTKVSDLNYYRLKIIDRNGKYIYSNIILIKNTAMQQMVWVVNNPFRDHVDLRFARPSGNTRLQLITTNGKIVSEKNLSGASGQQRWQLTSGLANGVYILRIVSDGIVFTNKLIKE